MRARPDVFAITILIGATPVPAIEMQFDWGDLVLCTTGSPNTVSNPTFTLGDVPDGTRFIRFALIDRDAPGYRHGGGVVPFTSQKVVARGGLPTSPPVRQADAIPLNGAQPP